MSVQLRVVLDQTVQVVDADQARAALALTVGLVQTAPRGCAVSAIVPSGADVQVPGIQDVRTLALGRRELAGAWQLGITPGVGGGLIHSPSLMAPLVRHDRLHDNDQTTVTLWDLDAWEAPHVLSKSVVGWHKAMLKRAVKHADAVVVPSHTMAERVAGLGRLSDRIRVIAGAAPQGFAEPADAAQRRDDLQLPERYVVVTGDVESMTGGLSAAARADIDVVVLDAADGTEPQIADAAAAAGLAERRAHIRGRLDDADRASVLAGAAAVVATSTSTAWPWRAVEAMALGVPVVAVDSGTHLDVIADGGLVVPADEITDALEDALGAGEKRQRVLAADRARAFSWASSAERVWALHADL
ncbi:glycosyltransferase [Microbacterium esteraromaticum]|uniref:Glycosyltransferase n=1 Tax=Microbacterium esteraromaticum TaxID=57043 RepID=A0A939DWH2_9MICO|nr:glycosyltransferase [Microbacterium esteraromaticum]MBN8205684.1 glycosyltransferase [Microbacterium esteraromaticum]MBN8415838.1 glycosyltransferase [Microbacterium esteraromaticum]MBY6060652.1 glycosyltransferase [Microbacterium esteraromaticum]